jgi:O-acetyl-ADP-ribose deacetylase (regulator of RNase III)
MNAVIAEYRVEGGRLLRLVHGDLTEERVDAIVNAANAQLAHGGGVAGAIARRAGPSLDRESRAWVKKHGPVPHHQPAITGGGNLPSKWVIHAVGPVWGEGGEEAKLASAVQGAMAVAEEHGISSIALPAISTGVYGFPLGRAADVILESILAYLRIHPESRLQEIRLTMIHQDAVDVFREAMARMLGPRPTA